MVNPKCLDCIKLFDVKQYTVAEEFIFKMKIYSCASVSWYKHFSLDMGTGLSKEKLVLLPASSPTEAHFWLLVGLHWKKCLHHLDTGRTSTFSIFIFHRLLKAHRGPYKRKEIGNGSPNSNGYRASKILLNKYQAAVYHWRLMAFGSTDLPDQQIFLQNACLDLSAEKIHVCLNKEWWKSLE